MARAIWTGTVGFGLVQIPVSLFAGEDKNELDMTLLDKRDFSPVGYQRVNKATGKEVPWDEIVKGYEYGEGEYVVLSAADFERANVKASRTIDILDFVDFASIDPRLIDRPYYLAPQKAGRKAYALLRETLRRSGKAGVGKVVIRTRQHLAAVVARDKALVVVLLRFADELRDESDLDLPDTDLHALGVTSRELAMADQLVESMAGEFDASQYVDEYRRDLLRLIEHKVEAGEVNQVPAAARAHAAAPKANVIDLASLLAKSLSPSAKPHPKKATRGRRRERPAKAKRTGQRSGADRHRRSA